MRDHAALGAEIVAELLPPDQVLWVRNHHERWDGAGYPDGLRGSAIPEGARILAVADAWDVMTLGPPLPAGARRGGGDAEMRGCPASSSARAAVDALCAALAAGAATAPPPLLRAPA